MKYASGTFATVPNIEILMGLGNAKAQSLYLALCKMANEKGWSCPRRDSLAEMIGASVKTVDRCLKVLVDCGVLRKASRIKKDGSPTSNSYVIVDISSEKKEETTEGGGDNRAIGVGSEMSLGRDTRDTRVGTTEPHKLNPLELKPFNYSPPLPPKGNGESEAKPEIQNFENFRKAYPGRKRGHDVELKDFKRKHKDWKDVALTLPAILQSHIEQRERAEKEGCFVPQWRNLKTWLNGRWWEEELNFEEEKKSGNGYKSSADKYEEERAAQERSDARVRESIQRDASSMGGEREEASEWHGFRCEEEREVQYIQSSDTSHVYD
jgi:predicted transcriptional regulator